MMRPTRKMLAFGAAAFLLVAAGTVAVVATTGDNDCPFSGPDAATHCATWDAHGAYCEAHPDEAKCHELLQHAEQARLCRDNPDDARCAKPASSDDHAKFCRDHPDSAHCTA